MTQDAVCLYDAQTIDTLPWPETEEGHHAKKYLIPLIKEGPQAFIENAKTSMQALTIGPHVLPIAIGETTSRNCYVCSLYSQYIEYGADELQRFSNPLLRGVLRGLLGPVGQFLKWGKIDKVIFVNNWLFSTNLHPDLSGVQIESITRALQARFPQHAIAFRSVTPSDEGERKHPLFQQGFRFIGSRKVHVLDTTSEHPFKARMFKSDLKILQKSDYEVIRGKDIPSEEIPRLQSLYNALYFGKYSQLNPRYTPKFFELVLREGILELKAFRKEGKIDGVFGHFTHHGVMTSPLFGYDTSLPQQLGLYRMISTRLALDAKEKQVLLNQSAGADSFKKLRRADSQIEYTAVYSRHLSWFRRLPWLTLQWVINTIGIPLMKRYDF